MSSWLQSQAKTIEKRCLNRFGNSKSFVSIENMLRDGAVISVQDDTGIIEIDKDKYKENKTRYLKDVGLN